MTPAEFKRKWARYSVKETAAYQEHFNDLCALLGHPTPATADPTGSESFCFQKRVVKDVGLFALQEPDRIAEKPEAEREQKEKFGRSISTIASLSRIAAEPTATRRLRFRSLHRSHEFQRHRSRDTRVYQREHRRSPDAASFARCLHRS